MAAKPQTRPRTKPPETRRAELMDAAERLFLAQGLAPTRIEQITEAADLAKGTFYLHFSSKEDLVAALGQRFGRTYVEALDRAIAKRPPHDWRGRLQTWAEAGVTGYLDAVALHDVLFHELHPHSREQDRDNIVVDHLADLLAAGEADGAWTLDDARFTAVFLYAGLHSVVDAALLHEKRVNRPRLIRRLQRICRRAVGLADEQGAQGTGSAKRSTP